ncbi:MAG: hypothetical protein K2Y16_12020 [Burkholderiales bacterium]|nr:hypothetical protein [Burkholderiales bacterium]
MISPYQAKYFAHDLTRRCAPDSVEKLAGAVASAQVDLNPHQIDAALFAFKSPLSKGAILADEMTEPAIHGTQFSTPSNPTEPGLVTTAERRPQ